MVATEPQADFSIVANYAPDSELFTTIGNGVTEHNKEISGDSPTPQPLMILAYSKRGILIGGCESWFYWNWLFANKLWVAKTWRGRGIGRVLFRETEFAARRLGLIGAYFETANPIAKAFYEHMGAVVCGQIDNRPPGMMTWFMKKEF